MTPSEEILHMIESVSPEDTARLDEIDFQVFLYLSGINPNDAGFVVYPGYLQSRDSLKAIRPEGYEWSKTKTQCHATKPINDRLQLQIIGDGKTEELAELSAIIQAIAHDRATDQGREG